MLQKIFSYSGVLLLAGAVLFATPNAGWAQARRGGGAHVSGYRGGYYGGYRGGYYSGYRGGYVYGYGRYYPRYGYANYRPYYYRPYYVYYPYYGYPYYLYNDAYPYLMAGVAYDPGYGSYYPGAGSAYPSASTSTSPPAGRYESYYPPPTGTNQQDRIARVTVTVPADARLWMNETLMSLTGSVREFDSPPLAPGLQYAYVITAAWKENGREVTQTQTVDVAAGSRVNVRFPQQKAP